MNAKRLWITLRLWTIRGAKKRARYLRDKKVLASMGEHCSWMQRTVPLYPRLVSIGNNVHTATNVSLVPHDVIHNVINNILLSQGKNSRVNEKLGCIEIGDNVFIGAGVRVLCDVRIGNNVIIGANALVTKDIPDNSVVAGVPAHVIGSFDDFIRKRMEEKTYPISLKGDEQRTNGALEKWLWDDFRKRRNE